MAIVFIGGETSGALRRRFEAHGHTAISCDNLPSEDNAGSSHIIGDIFDTLERLWGEKRWPDLAIFHFTCTYHTVSAAWAFNDPDFVRYPGIGYHQRVKPETLTGAARREARDKAEFDFRRAAALPIRRKVFENPVGTLSTRWRKPSQIIQPYQFGDDASKATCLWYLGKDGEELDDMQLPILPENRFPGRWVNGVERWGNQTDSGQNRLSPGEDRWKDRSRTFPGIASAMAANWSLLLERQDAEAFAAARLEDKEELNRQYGRLI
jgi:hypothetical protein